MHRSQPWDMMISVSLRLPDGRTAYVANEHSGTVTPIHTRTNTAEPPIHVGRRPIGITITPGQRIGYAHPAGAKQSVSTQDLGT